MPLSSNKGSGMIIAMVGGENLFLYFRNMEQKDL